MEKENRRAERTADGVPIQQHIIPAGRRNRPGGRNPDAYITIHEVADVFQMNQDSAPAPKAGPVPGPEPESHTQEQV